MDKPNKFTFIIAALIIITFFILIFSGAVALIKTFNGQPYLFEGLSLIGLSFVSLLGIVAIVSITDVKDNQEKTAKLQLEQEEKIQMILEQVIRINMTSGSGINLFDFISKGRTSSTYPIQNVSFEIIETGEETQDITKMDVQDLKEKMSDAIINEDYETAGLIRDELRKRKFKD